MTELLIFLLGCVAGGGYVAYRLKGARTWRETVVALGGGGPSNEK